MALKGITRTNRRVQRQQVNTVLNKMFYCVGSEWKQFHDGATVNRRLANAVAAVGEPVFVPGIIHEPTAHLVDGLDAGKTCDC